MVRRSSRVTLALASVRSAWALAVSCSWSRVLVSSSAILAFWIGSRTWLGHVDVPGQAEQEREVLRRRGPARAPRTVSFWNCLAGVADQQVDRASLRAVQPADRADLGQDHLLLDVLERAELADDVGGLLGEDAPDRREVEVDQEAVVGGELDPLARGVNRIVAVDLAQPVAPVGRPRGAGSAGLAFRRASTVRVVSE